MNFQQIRGATSIITFAGKKFLLDPFFADKGSFPPIPSPHNNLPNPLISLPVSIEFLVSVDAVIVTHMHHFDHFDDRAKEAIPKEMPIFTQNMGEYEDMLELGFKNVTCLTDKGVTFDNIRLFKTEAAHGQGEDAQKFYNQFDLPAEACGVVFQATQEKTLYLAGDTVWYEGVQNAIDTFNPEIIVVNAAHAQFYDGTPIIMGADDVYQVSKTAPASVIIASHMDAVNHARLTRVNLKDSMEEMGIAHQVMIPEDGETLVF